MQASQRRWQCIRNKGETPAKTQKELKTGVDYAGRLREGQEFEAGLYGFQWERRARSLCHILQEAMTLVDCFSHDGQKPSHSSALPVRLKTLAI